MLREVSAIRVQQEKNQAQAEASTKQQKESIRTLNESNEKMKKQIEVLNIMVTGVTGVAGMMKRRVIQASYNIIRKCM